MESGFQSLLAMIAIFVAFAAKSAIASNQEESSAFKRLVGSQSKDSLFVVEYVPSRDYYSVGAYPTPDELKNYLRIPREKNVLDGQYFKVVEGESDEALPLLDFDGRNAMFHLMRARSYYFQMDPSNPNLSRKVIVRVRMKRDYNVVTHFAERAESNDSRYIPADYENRWGAEIWFHVPQASTSGKGSTLLIASSVVASILSGPMALFSIPENYGRFHDIGMDLAKVPSVIYHEAFHYSTDLAPYPFGKGSDGDPLAEDLANYFGSVINGAPKIADIGAYVDSKRERDFSRIPTIKPTGKLDYNYTNFMPAVLWNARKASAHPELFDRAVWDSMSFMTAQTKPSEFPAVLLHSMGLQGLSNSPEYVAIAIASKTRSSSFAALDRIFSRYYGDQVGN
jgi:hypothetical protein